MIKLVSFGELLVDFTPGGYGKNGFPLLEQNPGGGPANVACAAAKLGTETAFLGKVGDDGFGTFLRQTLEAHQVDVQGLGIDPTRSTPLAFVHLSPEGERSFTFLRRDTADTAVTMEELPLSVFQDQPVFYFSSVMMAEGVSRQTSLALAEYARGQGCVTVFDPNLRFPLWREPEELRQLCRQAFTFSQIIKVSQEELSWLMEQTDWERAARQLQEEYQPMVLLVTRGEKGCAIRSSFGDVNLPAFPVVPVDTTGAGDTFTGAFISRMLSLDKPAIQCHLGDIVSCAIFASAAAALSVTATGAIPALPTLEQVEQFLRRNL